MSNKFVYDLLSRAVAERAEEERKRIEARDAAITAEIKRQQDEIEEAEKQLAKLKEAHEKFLATPKDEVKLPGYAVLGRDPGVVRVAFDNFTRQWVVCRTT